MNRFLGNAEELLEQGISGFHQYVLGEHARLQYVSRNFCDLLGYTEQELQDDVSDRYAALVYPSDKADYSDFLHELSKAEQTLTLQYRVVCKDGEVLYVNDTATSRQLQDGSFVMSSVLTDITSLKKENRELRLMSEIVPHGVLRFTCEKNPKITYLNDQILKILRFPEIKDGELDYLELYKSNIYLMLPMEERRRFSRFLTRVSSQNVPVSGELSILRFDGTKARLHGWVTKTVNEQGTEEFQSICMDITEAYRVSKATETQRYVNALTEVYDKIFEYDFSARTVKYLYSKNKSAAGWLQNIAMDLEEATAKWLKSNVCEDDFDRVSLFFDEFCNAEFLASECPPPQIRYRARSSDGEVKAYAGIFLKLDSNVGYFCCRRMGAENDNDALRNENDSLRGMNENMQELVMRFTDGMVAFEVDGDQVKPLYASDNVCVFFGYSKEEWIALTQKSLSLDDFVSKSGVEYDKFLELFERGEAEFEYLDVATQTPHRIKAVCSRMFSGNSSKQYVMLYHVGEKSAAKQTRHENGRIFIRTFGYFDVFVDEKPIAFRNKKSKELFALLVDRRGGYVSSEEAISFLWEDEPVSAVTLARYRKVALRLKNILEEYGIADVVESVDGKRRIVAEKVRCDLFAYLSDSETYAGLFKGSYLTNYSWGENTLGELLGEHTY